MIKLTYKDKEYQLTFTRESVKEMESKGFRINELDTKPITMLPLLFSGAFIAKHRGTKPKLIDEIYDEIPNKEELIGALGEMYAETLNSLFKGNDKGNVKWEVE